MLSPGSCPPENRSRPVKSLLTGASLVRLLRPEVEFSIPPSCFVYVRDNVRVSLPKGTDLLYSLSPHLTIQALHSWANSGSVLTSPVLAAFLRVKQNRLGAIADG